MLLIHFIIFSEVILFSKCWIYSISYTILIMHMSGTRSEVWKCQPIGFDSPIKKMRPAHSSCSQSDRQIIRIVREISCSWRNKFNFHYDIYKNYFLTSFNSNQSESRKFTVFFTLCNVFILRLYIAIYSTIYCMVIINCCLFLLLKFPNG